MPKLAVTLICAAGRRWPPSEKTARTASANSLAAARIGHRQEHGELLAAQPAGDGARAGRGPQPRREFRDDPVAGGMSMPVVERLEPVEIGHDQRDRQLGPRARREQGGGAAPRSRAG